jgi:hypothetical protein
MQDPSNFVDYVNGLILSTKTACLVIREGLLRQDFVKLEHCTCGKRLTPKAAKELHRLVIVVDHLLATVPRQATTL